MLLDAFIEQNKLYNNEGERGVSNLCKICRALGYKDYFQNGQMAQGGVTGDLTEFLADNPGCIEAIINWMRDHEASWADQLVDQVEAPDMDEEDEDNG